MRGRTSTNDREQLYKGLRRHFRVCVLLLELAVVGSNWSWNSRISEILIQTCWLGGGQQEMAKPYSQDLRDRVIDAVKKGEMSRRAAARRYEISESVAIKWLERVERDGSRAPVGHGGHRASKLMPHRDFLEAARAEKSDVTNLSGPHRPQAAGLHR